MQHLAESNQHYAIMAIYTITWKGQKVISDNEPVMLLVLEDVVRHRNITGTRTNAEGCAKKRCAKGGRKIDRLRELMNDKENWLESKNDYLYPGTFSDPCC